MRCGTWNILILRCATTTRYDSESFIVYQKLASLRMTDYDRKKKKRKTEQRNERCYMKQKIIETLSVQRDCYIGLSAVSGFDISDEQAIQVSAR